MLLAIVLFLIGLGLLVLGAESLVRGAASLASKLGVSALVVGLTVVAFGTSAPELIVNLVSAWQGNADIAIGNIIGSNIANILLILGIVALLTPVKVKHSTVWREIPFALLASLLVLGMGNDALLDGNPFNAITRTDGLSLISLFFVFLFYTFGIAKRGHDDEENKVATYSYGISLLLTVSGLILLFYGGKLLVDNAVILAKLAGLSESLIGLTIVAVGTSLPELATSVVAAWHGHDDLAVGNIVGSNIFNIFWILGVTGTMLQLPFNPATNIDVMVAVGATLALFFAMFLGNKHRLDRWQGVVFLLAYFAYVAYLVVMG